MAATTERPSEIMLREAIEASRRWNRVAANYAAGLSIAIAALKGEKPADEALDFAQRALRGENVAGEDR